jgi:hypothetical protein
LAPVGVSDSIGDIFLQRSTLMAHELYTRTNQKLYFAGLALETWKQAEQGGMANAQAQAQAASEAAVFHLYGALLGICHEVAGYYRQSNATASTVEQLLNTDALKAAPSPEFAELVELATQPSTWTGQLLTRYRALFQPPKAPSKSRVEPGMPLIQAVSLNEDEEGLQPEAVEQWRQELKKLALRFRESLTEC